MIQTRLPTSSTSRSEPDAEVARHSTCRAPRDRARFLVGVSPRTNTTTTEEHRPRRIRLPRASRSHRASPPLGPAPNDALKNEIVAAIDSIALPELKPDGSNKDWVETSKKYRVSAALAIALVSPEFLIQK